jgi:hypothetical protein
VILFFLTSDREAAYKEAESFDWVRIAADRWATPDRDDVRLVSRATEFSLLPGGTVVIPASDLASCDPERNPFPYQIKKLAEEGTVKWRSNPSMDIEETWNRLISKIRAPRIPRRDESLGSVQGPAAENGPGEGGLRGTTKVEAKSQPPIATEEARTAFNPALSSTALGSTLAERNRKWTRR